MIAEQNLPRALRLQEVRTPIRNLPLALLSGLMMALAFPGWELWFLGWVALAPLTLAAGRERTAMRALGLGVAAGTLFFTLSCWWLTYSPIHYADFPTVVAYALLLVPCTVCGLFFGLFALVVQVLVKRLGMTLLTAAPFVWVACEYLRLEVTGIGWNMLGYSQAFQPVFTQLAAGAGVYAVSFVLACASASLSYDLLAPTRRGARGFMFVTLALVLGNVVYGMVALSSITAARAGLVVIAVQPNIPVFAGGGQPGERELYPEREAQARLERLTVAELDRAGAPPVPIPALLVWPEMPVNFFYDDLPEHRQFLAEMAQHRGDYLLFNSIGSVPPRTAAESGHTNRAQLLLPDGSAGGRYDKVHLLPFGEFVPGRAFLPDIPAILYDFTAGSEYQLLHVGEARLGVSICFESTFPSASRYARLQGASAFINITNDGWFGPTPEARQHLAHAILRSVENRTEQVRVTNSGHSARIDAAGRLVDETELFQDSTRRWLLPEHPVVDPPLYVWWGDWFALVCTGVVAVLVVAALVRRQPRSIEFVL